MLYTYRHISIVHTIQTEHIEYVQIHAYICYSESHSDVIVKDPGKVPGCMHIYVYLYIFVCMCPHMSTDTCMEQYIQIIQVSI